MYVFSETGCPGIPEALFVPSISPSLQTLQNNLNTAGQAWECGSCLSIYKGLDLSLSVVRKNNETNRRDISL